MLRSRTGAILSLVCTLLLAACGTQRPEDRPFQTLILTATPPQGAQGYPAPGAPAPSAPAPSAPVPSGGAAYPAPVVTAGPTATPGPFNPTEEGRTQSALASYKVALEAVQSKFESVQFYALIPSQVMLQNLGNPPVKLGWFFKFRAANDPSDHFVQIVDGQSNGIRSLIPLGQDEPQQPIDVASLKIDSDAVLAKFRERAPTLGITVSNLIAYDLELIYLQGNPAPVWSVLTPDGTWLYALNALTGEEVKNPRG